jgi:type III secretion protein Q
MRETTTLVGPGPEEQNAPAKPRARRVTLVPLKRFSQAHLDLAARGSIRDEALAALAKATAALAEQLGEPVSANARLLDATLQPLQHLGKDATFVVVELSGASAMALVELEAPVVSHLLKLAAGSDAGATGLTALTRVESAALGWLVLSAISGLRTAREFDQRFAPRLVNLTMDRGEALRSIDATVRHLAIELQLSGAHPIGTARLLVPARMLQLAIQSAPQSEPPAPPEALLSKAITAGVRFGRAQLLRADVGDLAPGDAIVFAGTRLVEGRFEGPARFLTRSFELSGELGADGFVVSRAAPLTRKEHRMSTLNVDVEIELTSIQLPIRQLGAIAPGAVLPLHITAAQTVTLRIEGKPVALAELVEVEGQIGARITAMLEDAP